MAERWTSLRAIPAQSPEAEAARRHLFRELEAALDAGAGFAPFRTTRLARMFSAWLEEYDRDGLRFPGFVVMPNHVHLVTDSVEFGSVEAFQRAWRRFKGASGRWLNAELGRTGPFWQYAWYDRWVRTPEEWRKWMRYLEQNPVRAGLCECPKDYPFARIAQEPPR